MLIRGEEVVFLCDLGALGGEKLLTYIAPSFSKNRQIDSIPR